MKEKKDKIFGLIMAGGGGTRLWPLSRKKTPKQLLNITGNDYLINETISRIEKVVNTSNIFVVTNAEQTKLMKKTVNNRLQDSNYFIEPLMKNTTACICYSALKILKKYGDGVVIITPSDSYIKKNDNYVKNLNAAIKHVKKTDSIVAIGISPTYPATEFGYLYSENSTLNLISKVDKFTEKPNKELAKEYFKNGNYYWNAGIFVCKLSTIIKEIKKHAPNIFNLLNSIYEFIWTEKESKLIKTTYQRLDSISIDYSVMEKTKNLYLIPSDIGWSDLGTWDSLKDVYNPDKNGNITTGDVLVFMTRNSTIVSNNVAIVTCGIKNLIIVQTHDILFVCNKNKLSIINKIHAFIKKQKRNDLL